MKWNEIITESADTELQAWFGSSKIVDADGNPLVCFHGTENEPFDAFDLSQSGQRQTLPSSGLGIFFAPSDSVKYNYGRNVMRAYLRMERPYAVRLDTLNRWRREDIPSWREQLIRKGHDGIIASVGSTPYEFVVFTAQQVWRIGWDQHL